MNLPFGFLDQSELAPLSRPSLEGRAFCPSDEAHNISCHVSRLHVDTSIGCKYIAKCYRINPILLLENCNFIFCFSNSQCKSDETRSRRSTISMHFRRVSGDSHDRRIASQIHIVDDDGGAGFYVTTARGAGVDLDTAGVSMTLAEQAETRSLNP
ncbi:hypothetical protein HGG76_21785 [Ochrobactrum tritici]|uniref:Uncharacterized protein n=1 Tax=Brucella tritici TaxID=94626 RepID=A0A7X6FS53_9HYPH|nr:hypothetical protein [Brucella tritici]